MSTLRSQSRARLIGAAVVALLALGACGSGDDGSDSSATSEAEAQPYVDALAAELAEPSDEGDVAFTEHEAECLAVAIIDAAGAATLADAGVSPQELADADSLNDFDIDIDAEGRAALEDAAVECTDIGQLLAEGFAEGAGFEANCLVEQIDEDAFASLFVDQIVLGEDAEPLGESELSRLVFESADDACLEDVLVQSIASAGDVTEEQVACLSDEIDDGLAREAFLAFAEGSEPSAETSAALDAAVETCVGL